MSNGIDLLHLFPKLVAIGQQQLQAYCNEWLQRPIAHQYDVSEIIGTLDLFNGIG
jgi:hypothetical protein